MFSSTLKFSGKQTPSRNGGSISHLTPFLAVLLVVAGVSGCGSKQDKALEQAKAQAAKTGQAQQVVSVDKNGTTTTTIVQPAAAGQTTQATTTTVTPAAGGATPPPPSEPAVSAVPAPPIVPAKVTIPAGSTLAIRVDQRIGVKSSHKGDKFTGEVVDPVIGSDNGLLIPKGSPVTGVVAESHRRGHFKGRSELELRLTSLTLNGTQYPLTTKALAESKKGKGKRTAGLIGGGAGLGMLVGGIATGGVGLVVGGLVGGGAGTAAAGMTGNRDLDIPAETVVHFKLADDLVVQP